MPRIFVKPMRLEKYVLTPVLQARRTTDYLGSQRTSLRFVLYVEVKSRELPWGTVGGGPAFLTLALLGQL